MAAGPAAVRGSKAATCAQPPEGYIGGGASNWGVKASDVKSAIFM